MESGNRTNGITLLPCPFCGSHQVDLFGDDELGWLARCADCRVCTFICDTKDETIEAWNTRAERTCHNTEQGNTELRTGMPVFFCSECGELYVTDSRVYYCPNCGAKVVDA